jgi:hypothetical protein
MGTTSMSHASVFATNMSGPSHGSCRASAVSQKVRAPTGSEKSTCGTCPSAMRPAPSARKT